MKPKALWVFYPEDLDLTNAPLWTDDYSDLFSVHKIPTWKRVWASLEPRGISDSQAHGQRSWPAAAESSDTLKSNESTSDEGEA